MDKKKHYRFLKDVCWRWKDISLGFHLFSERDIVCGPKARITGIALDIIFFHFRVAIGKSYY